MVGVFWESLWKAGEVGDGSFYSMTFFVRQGGTEILISSVPSRRHDMGFLYLGTYTYL